MDRDAEESLSSDESEELLPLRGERQRETTTTTGLVTTGSATNRKMGRHIYSDSESSSSAQEKDPEEQATVESNVSDSQNQQTIRTKAAMKEFVPGTAATTASTTHASSKPKSTREGKDAKEAGTSIGNSTKSKTMTNAKLLYPADLLVVPQRQAAKKASENMRSTNLATALQPDASDRVREPETNSIPTSAKNKLKDSSSRAALETDKCSLEKVRPKEQPQKAGGNLQLDWRTNCAGAVPGFEVHPRTAYGQAAKW